MKNKFIPTLIGIVIIGTTGGLAYWTQSEERTPVEEKNDPAHTSYSASDVAAHNTTSDCWAIINGGVYDLTSWIPRHPGGEKAIEGLCGKDGSAGFNAQHEGGAAQQAILAGLKVGTLTQ